MRGANIPTDAEVAFAETSNVSKIKTFFLFSSNFFAIKRPIIPDPK